MTYATPTTIAIPDAATCLGVNLGRGKTAGVRLTMIANPETAPGGSNATDCSKRSEDEIS